MTDRLINILVGRQVDRQMKTAGREKREIWQVDEYMRDRKWIDIYIEREIDDRQIDQTKRQVDIKRTTYSL